MAHISGGDFWGYREIFIPRRGGVGRRPPRVIPNYIRMPLPELDMLIGIPYKYKVFEGSAGDNYPADYSMFGFDTKIVMGIIKNHPATIEGTIDGVTPLEEKTSELGFLRLESLQGFKIKNSIPGLPAKYQMIGFR